MKSSTCIINQCHKMLSESATWIGWYLKSLSRIRSKDRPFTTKTPLNCLTCQIFFSLCLCQCLSLAIELFSCLGQCQFLAIWLFFHLSQSLSLAIGLFFIWSTAIQASIAVSVFHTSPNRLRQFSNLFYNGGHNNFIINDCIVILSSLRHMIVNPLRRFWNKTV